MSRACLTQWSARIALPLGLVLAATAAAQSPDPARLALQAKRWARARSLLHDRAALVDCSTDAAACVRRDPLLAVLLARAEVGLRHIDTALPIFEALHGRMVESGQGDVAARVTLRIARSLLDNGQTREALVWLDRSPAEESLLAASWLRARALRLSGRPADALSLMRELAPEQLDMDAPWRPRLLAEAALAARAANAPAARLSWLTTLWIDHPRLDGDSLGAPDLFAAVETAALRTQAGMVGQVRRAEALLAANALGEALSESRRLHPKDPELACRARYVEGKALRNQRRYTQAFRVLTPLVARCPTQAPRALYLMGRVTAYRGQTAEALASFDRLVAGYPDHPLADDALFLAGDLLSQAGRWVESNRYFQRVVDNYAAGDYHDEAEWRLAFNALRSGQLARAQELLDATARAHASDGDARHYQRALYWRARLSLSNERAAALDDLDGLLRSAPVSYYGMQARRLLRQVDPARERLIDRWLRQQAHALSAATATSQDLPLPPLSDARLGHRLVRLGLDEEAREVLGRIDAEALDLSGLLVVAADLRQAGDTHAAHWMVRGRAEKELHGRPTADSVTLWRAGFPLGYRTIVTAWAQRRGLDPYLLYGLIREESAFEAPVVSWAGAVGLMQLMPSTAREEADLDHLAGFTLAQLTQPEINIRLGSSHIARRIKLFSGNHALAIAAYNAGPGNVRKWIRQTQQRDLARYIESIPVEQTREYTKRVLRSWQVYRYLYAPEAPTVDLPERAFSSP